MLSTRAWSQINEGSIFMSHLFPYVPLLTHETEPRKKLTQGEASYHLTTSIFHSSLAFSNTEVCF